MATHKVTTKHKSAAHPEGKPDDPHPGWHFYNELLKSLREDIVRNRISTDNLSEHVKKSNESQEHLAECVSALNQTMQSILEEQRQDRMGRRTTERTKGSAGRRLSDRKGTGEKSASRRK